MDKKLIAKWQGYQGGGQLILDTCTEVFGGDDEDYERGQLEKIGRGSVPETRVAARTEIIRRRSNNFLASAEVTCFSRNAFR